MSETPGYCRNTPLIGGALHGQTEAVQVLLEEAGADVSATGKYQFTALHAAVQGGHKPTVKMLLDYRADIESKDKDG